jgi:hypothetical protein
VETERRHLQNAPLSPPLAKASAGVNTLAEAFLIGFIEFPKKNFCFYGVIS